MEKWGLLVFIHAYHFSKDRSPDMDVVFIFETQHTLPRHAFAIHTGSLIVSFPEDTNVWSPKGVVKIVEGWRSLYGSFLKWWYPPPGEPITFIFGVITHILGVQNLHFSWFWGSRATIGFPTKKRPFWGVKWGYHLNKETPLWTGDKNITHNLDWFSWWLFYGLKS